LLPFDPFSPASNFDGVKILASGFQELFQRNEKPKVVLNFLGPPHGKGDSKTRRSMIMMATLPLPGNGPYLTKISAKLVGIDG